MSTCDWHKLVGRPVSSQYELRIANLRKRGMHVAAIENTVEETISNLKDTRFLSSSASHRAERPR